MIRISESHYLTGASGLVSRCCLFSCREPSWVHLPDRNIDASATNSLHTNVSNLTMDKHSKLSALEGKIIDDILASPWNEFKVEPREEEKPLASFLFPTKMPQHIYEGTDSEEEDGYVINAKSLKTTTAASGDPSIRAYIQAPPRPDVFNVGMWSTRFSLGIMSDLSS